MKLKNHHTTVTVRNELAAHDIQFPDTTGWIHMLKLLKAHENKLEGAGAKYFEPVISYDNFKWNNTHFNDDEYITYLYDTKASTMHDINYLILHLLF